MDEGHGIALDSAGNVYVAGYTMSSDFPATARVGSSASPRGFVAKLNPQGTALLYSTYIDPAGARLAVDRAGNAHIASTVSSQMYTTPGAFQPRFRGKTDAYVLKLNAQGTAPIYASHLGGTDDDRTDSVVLDNDGNAYVSGTTRSTDFFPVTAGAFQSRLAGGDDIFVTKINPEGTVALYSTYLGGSGDETFSGIAVDGGGNAHVTGKTRSPDFPVTSDAFKKTLRGGSAIFVAKLNASGAALLYSTFFGGSDESYSYGLGR